DCAGVGGPNLPPPNDNWRIRAMGYAPGGPNPVLVSDRTAEHVPGCNMMFRKEALLAIGGFDPVFRTAGDDVDLCWRLLEKGGVIRSEEHTSELQSRSDLVCRLLLEKKKIKNIVKLKLSYII